MTKHSFTTQIIKQEDHNMKVAIFGAGTMGSGIAQVFAANGHMR